MQCFTISLCYTSIYYITTSYGEKRVSSFTSGKWTPLINSTNAINNQNAYASGSNLLPNTGLAILYKKCECVIQMNLLAI